MKLLEFCEICLHKCSVNGYLCLADINCGLLLNQTVLHIFMRAPCDQTVRNLVTKSSNNEIGSWFFFCFVVWFVCLFVLKNNQFTIPLK